MEDNKIELKDFIYLDTNIITSMLAQINNGRTLNFVQETNNYNIQGDYEQDKTVINKFTLNHSNKASIKVFESQTSGEFSAQEDNGVNAEIAFMGQSQKELINKTFDDDAFDIISNFLNANQLIKTKFDNINIGDYLLTNDIVRIFNIDYLIDFFKDKDLKDVLGMSKLSKSTATQAQKQKNAFSDAEKILKSLKVLFPTKYLIISNNLFLMVNDDFFRYKDSLLSLRNNTQVTVLSKIIKKHNKISTEQLKTSDSIFNLAPLFDFATDAMDLVVTMMMPNIPKNIFYVQPIAIY